MSKDSETFAQCGARWAGHAKDALVGRKIVDARYMTQEECEQLGWHSSAIVLRLDDGNLIYPSRDDEGNNAGALFTNDKGVPTLPVIHLP